MKRPLLALAVLAWGCDPALAPEAFQPGAFAAVTQAVAEPLAAVPAFADERGGGLFVDPSGRPVRVRPNGQRGVLDTHPRNPTQPGAATGVFPLGPYSALVATSQGLFVADQGWLVSPPWHAALEPSGVRATAVTADGVAWVAHEAGLYRVEGGALAEFTVDGAALPGVTALAAGPTADGVPGAWFAREGRLFSATPRSRTAASVREAGLPREYLGAGVTALAALGPGRDDAGEVWALSDRGLLQYSGTAWRRYELPGAPRQLLAAGRFAWLQAGDALYRYDADARAWSEATGLPGVPTLLAVDAAGAAWVRVGEAMLSVAAGVAPRARGLFEGAAVYDGLMLVQASLPASAPPDALTWTLDDEAPRTVALDGGVAGEGPLADVITWSLGGVQADGTPRPVALGHLGEGRHALSITARTGAATATRRVHFDFLGGASATSSWAASVQPLNEARCARCHSAGTEPELSTYAQWKQHAAAIATAVRERRMPADGPLDPASVELVQRWVNGGALP